MNFVLTTWSNNFCVWKELGDVSHRYLFKTKYFKNNIGIQNVGTG